MIKVETKEDAWNMIKKFHPGLSFAPNAVEKGTYDPVVPESELDKINIEYVADLESRLEVNLKDGESFNIWITGRKLYNTDLTVGMITNSKPFPGVTINEVQEVKLENIFGFTLEGLADGKLGIVFHVENNETSSFHTNSIAYVKMI